MAYIPENKYQVLYTGGREYKFKLTNRSYIGKYLKLSNGKVFAGDHPSRIIGPLVPIRKRRSFNIRPGVNNDTYSILQPQIAEEQGNHIIIPSYTHLPSALDYSRGYFTRYLSVRLNTKQYQEISRDTFENFNIKNYDKANNRVFSIEWSLNENNEPLNTKTLTKLNYQLPGIFNFFPDKSQFGLKRGIVNLSQTARIYPTGEAVPKPLPAAYQIGNVQVNTTNNPEVPEFQHCGNCIFNVDGFCKKWQANIKSDYWCRTWETIEYDNSPPSTGPDHYDHEETYGETDVETNMDEGVNFEEPLETPTSPSSPPSQTPTSPSTGGRGGY
jgi:hypothetical protein